MSKLEGLKEDLGYFKFCFGIAVATFLALIGWIATNYNIAELWLVIAAVLSAIVFALIAIVLNKKMRKIIKKIYETKKDE